VRPDLVASFDVHADGRLIENEELRIVQQRARNREPALHSSGEMTHHVMPARGETHQLEHFCDASVGVGHVVQRGRKPEILPRTDFAVESGFLRKNADTRAQGGRISR
jgi:hypothetical protein